jgi:CRISPR-associated protein Cas2
MFVIISYDIVEDQRRTRVLKLLKGYGTRVQYSVFECYLTPKQVEKVGRELRKLIDLDTDSVRCYMLDAAARRRIQIVGIGNVTADTAYYLIGGAADKGSR